LPKRDPELAALDRQAKAEEEASDLEAFIDAYDRSGLPRAHPCRAFPNNSR
jgi:hypothetical protein